jgi:transposase
MSWTGNSLRRETQAVVVNQNLNAQIYQDLIIRPCVITHVQANHGMMFMQDNVPCHTEKTTREILQRNNIRVLDWPPCSPDLNAIENL